MNDPRDRLMPEDMDGPDPYEEADRLADEADRRNDMEWVDRVEVRGE